MELVPAQGEQTAQRDVKAVHGNVCYQDGILNYRCTTVSLQRASKGFKACQDKIFGSLVLGPSALLMTKGRDRLPVNTSDRYGSQFTICCLGPEV